VVVPAHSGAFSALGCLVSPLRYDAVQTHRARLDGWDVKLVEDRYRALEEQCLRPILDEGHAPGDVTLTRSMDVRYVGQNYEVELPYRSDAAGLRAAFEARHRQLYGYATGESVECVNLRVTAQLAQAGLRSDSPPLPQRGRGEGEGAEGERAAPVGTQRAYFPETGEITMPRHDREALGPGALVSGPAVIEDEWSTIVVYPGQRAAADARGHLVLDLEAGA